MTVAPTVAVLVCGAVAAVTTTVAQARAATPQSYQFVDLGTSFSPNYENQAGVVVGAVNPGDGSSLGRVERRQGDRTARCGPRVGTR